MIIPTRDRRDTLLATLTALDRDSRDLPVEAVVADDGSVDNTAEAVTAVAAGLQLDLELVRRDAPGGPAAARNSAVAAAKAPVLLFLGDDMPPGPGLIERHLAFHRAASEGRQALLGRIVPAPGSDSPFARWLHEHGKQFAFAHISRDTPVPRRFFYAANLSLRAELLAAAGGFDERFEFGHEETELARRLERLSISITHDPEALALHDHPTDLNRTLRRMRGFGRSHRLLCQVLPDEPQPPRPALRHRLAAAALLAAGPARRSRTRSWTFLCEEAAREAFWGEADPPDPAVRIGRGLAARAAADPATRPG